VPDQLDDAVIAAARRGDATAFTTIWRVLAPKVAGYLAARGAEDPDGLTSDVFLAVLPKLRDVTGGAAGLRTFVFSVAHARMVDEARRRARRPATVAFDVAQHDSIAPSAEQQALDELDTDHVRGVLARLPADYRDVLALRVIGDLSVEQAATALGRSTGAVKQLQRRALLALRAELERVTGAASASITELP
jgi:RNA polymerase sigma-70 factor (ECF subfamily)